MAFVPLAANYTIAEDPYAHHRVMGSDYWANVGFGLVPGIARVAAIGYNPDVDTATTPEDVWTGGGLYPWIVTAAPLSIVSTSVNDAAAGTGARTVTVTGLDSNYYPLTETVTLNGTTIVNMTRLFFRINSIRVASAGSGQTNAGTINVQDTTGGTIRGIVPVGYSVSRQTQYTVAAGKTLQIISILGSAVRTSGSSRSITLGNVIIMPNFVQIIPLELGMTEATYRHDAVPGIILPEKSSFSLRVMDVGVNDTAVSAGWLGILRTNEKLPE